MARYCFGENAPLQFVISSRNITYYARFLMGQILGTKVTLKANEKPEFALVTSVNRIRNALNETEVSVLPQKRLH